MFNHKSKRPSLLYIECKSRDISRRGSRLSDIFDDTNYKQNTFQQQRQQYSTTKNKDIQSLNIMYKQAMFDQQILQDQTYMLIEDLNGKLLQRAELIGQIEELEELIDYHKKHSSIEIGFTLKLQKLEILIQQYQKQSLNTSQLLRQKEIFYQDLKKLVNQEAFNAFGMYLKQWGHEFELIKNNYGLETYQQVLAEKQQEFVQNLTTLYEKKINGILQLFKNYQLLKNSMLNNIEFVDNNLNPELFNIKQAIKQNQELIQKILRIHLDQGISSNFNEKMQNLELKNIKLAQKLNEIARNQKFAQETTKTKKENDEFFLEDLIEFSEISQIDNCDLKNEIVNSFQKQQYKAFDKSITQTQNFQTYDVNKETQLKFNQLLQIYQQNNIDTDTKNFEGQCISEDSTLQHFQEINLALIQSGKSMDIYPIKLQQSQQPLEIQDSQSSQQNLFFRLKTITEEQLSSKRNQQYINQKSKIDTSPVNQNLKTALNLKKIKQLDNFSQSKGIPLTDQTKRFSNNETQSKDQTKNEIEPIKRQIQIPFSNGSLFFSNQDQTSISSQKNQIDQISKLKDKTTLSEKLSKQKKSKSFDSTSNKEQLKQFTGNTSTNNGHSKEIQQVQNTINLLIPIEQEILRILKPLLKGQQIYKRFSSTKPNIKKQEFDPFSCQNPANYGFCPRIICLAKNFECIEFKNQMKINQVDTYIKLDEIMRTMIPSPIQQCIQVKKQIQCKYILSKQESTVQKISFWPMFLITQNDGRIELLFNSESVLEQWQANFLFLKNNIKTLQIINKKLHQ
ncbi:unnamed protein product [Paramecium sonneborni]|uniref:Uncharacterized protein n=1 Tax=Paramecium sonneborni TaxID=65129 RepID=A0A8S1NRI7_9CILI|nr:unnamed protein product [Paramecium sonneborni]